MIGCDKCDEWYHDKCVGLDIVSVLFSIVIDNNP